MPMGMDFEHITAIEGASPAFVESMYENYQDDPSSVDESWRQYFDALEAMLGNLAVGKENGVDVAGIISEIDDILASENSEISIDKDKIVCSSEIISRKIEFLY